MLKCSTCGRFLNTKDPKGGVNACKCCAEKGKSITVNKNKNSKKSPHNPQGACAREMAHNMSSPGSAYSDASEEGPQLTQGGARLSSKVDIGEEMRLLRVEFREMRVELTRELGEMRREVGELRASISDCEARIETLEGRVKELEATQTNSAEIDRVVSTLRVELNNRDQELLSCDLEISNLPEESGENPLHLVGLISGKLGMQLNPRDIVYAERVGATSKREELSGSSQGSSEGRSARPRHLVVRMANRQLRDDLLQSARVRRGASTTDLGLQSPARRFYINERLTRYNKALFYRVRQAAGRLGWRYAWTKRGKILVKQAEGKRTHTIRDAGDLERVFGSGAARDTAD